MLKNENIENQDITDFIKKHNDILIISDIEGLSSTTQIDKIMKHLTTNINSKNGIIYNGDVIDNTITGNNKDPYISTNDMPVENLCSLKLLELLVQNMDENATHAKCMIGNRDLNKIKMLALNQAQDDSRWWVNGTTILDIAEQLVKNTDTLEKYNAFWKITNMQPFNPFWAPNRTLLNENWFGNSPKISQKPTTLEDRFYIIFGVDTAQGTISAQNNIACIAKELGLNLDTKDSSYLDVSPSPSPINTKIENKRNEKHELDAAIAFTVFARLLDKQLSESNSKLIKAVITKSKIWNDKFDNLDGYLYKYLTMAKCASYAEINNKILLFAHGGITSEFITSKNTGIDILNKITTEKWQNVSTKAPVVALVGGGNKIFEKIDDFCAIYKKAFNELYKSQDSSFTKINDNDIYPSLVLQVLNSICTPADNHPLIKELHYDTKLSPIQVSSPMTTDLINACIQGNCVGNGKQIINIFSHIPQGIGYTFGSLNSNMFFINTDFSLSFMKDPKLAMGITKDSKKQTPTKEYNENFLLLHLKHTNDKDDKDYHFLLEGKTTLYLKNAEYEIKNGILENDFINHTRFEYKKNTITLPLPSPLSSQLPSPETNDIITLDYNKIIKFTNLFNNMNNCNFDNADCFYKQANRDKKMLFNHGTAKINGKECKILLFPFAEGENTKEKEKNPKINKYIGIFPLENQPQTQKGGSTHKNKYLRYSNRSNKSIFNNKTKKNKTNKTNKTNKKNTKKHTVKNNYK